MDLIEDGPEGFDGSRLPRPHVLVAHYVVHYGGDVLSSGVVNSEWEA